MAPPWTLIQTLEDQCQFLALGGSELAGREKRLVLGETYPGRNQDTCR